MADFEMTPEMVAEETNSFVGQVQSQLADVQEAAAAVAEATAGLSSDEHIPNVAMFVIGAKSPILAFGLPDKNVRLEGLTTNGQVTVPKVHVISAPVVMYDSAMVFYSVR